MRDLMNSLVFGWYPYLVLIVFLLGSGLRFGRAQHNWPSRWSGILRDRQLMWGVVLSLGGILILFVGHFIGLLTPIWVFDAIGISHNFKQWMAIVIGGTAGIFGFIGINLLVYRLLLDARFRASTAFADSAMLIMIYAQLTLGLASIAVSLEYLDGCAMVKFMAWAQGILTLKPGVATLIAGVNPIFKLHLFLGMTILLVFPFTRLMNVWNMPVRYFGRGQEVSS